MSKSITAVVLLGLLTVVAACAPAPEPVMVEEPVMEEPMFEKM